MGILRSGAVWAASFAALYCLPGAMETLQVGIPAFTDDDLPPMPVFRVGIAFADWLERMQNVFAPPNLVMFKHMMGHMSTQAIHAAVRLRIFDELAAGPRSLDELTRAALGCGAECSAGNIDGGRKRVHRLLRALESLRFIRRVGELYAHTRTGEFLARDHPMSLSAAALNYGDDQFTFVSSMHETVRSGESAYRLHHDGLGQWEYCEKNKEQGEIFASTMTAIAQMGHNLAVAEDYPFADVRTVVDIGCSFGVLLDKLLEKWPAMTGSCFDRAETIEWSRARWAPRGTRGRVTLAPGDFFNASTIPAGADAYTMKQILHDWNDDESVAILRNVRTAMGGRGKLLVIERVVREGESHVASQGNALADLLMLATFSDGTRERTLQDWEALFAAAGFSLDATVPTRSPFEVIVGTPLP